MTRARWYSRPEGEGLTLRKAPRLASWNKATDPDQVRLREYLEDTAELLTPSLVSGPWALLLDVGLPTGRDLIDMADLDNYAFPLATRLRSRDLVSVWCTKRNADTSRVVVARAQEVSAPRTTFTVRTTASSQSKAYKEQVRSAVPTPPRFPPEPSNCSSPLSSVHNATGSASGNPRSTPSTRYSDAPDPTATGTPGTAGSPTSVSTSTSMPRSATTSW